MFLLAIAIAIAIALTAPALAHDAAVTSATTSPPITSGAQGVCLSDGQHLHGTVTERGAHVDVEIRDAVVRVPVDSMAEACGALELRPLPSPAAVRTFTLVDGQQLHGVLLPGEGDRTLELLDAHRIVVPSALVIAMDRPDSGSPALAEAVEAQRRSARRRRTKTALGATAGTLVAVVGVTAIVGVATWGYVGG